MQPIEKIQSSNSSILLWEKEKNVNLLQSESDNFSWQGGFLEASYRTNRKIDTDQNPKPR